MFQNEKSQTKFIVHREKILKTEKPFSRLETLLGCNGCGPEMLVNLL